MSDTVLDDVRRTAGDVFGVPADQVSASSSRETIASWDSLAHVNLVLALEQQFGVQFLPEEMMEMLNIELVAMIVSEKLAQKAAGG